MKLFCRHDYRAHSVIRGENLLGSVEYAIAFYCIHCGRRRLDKGWSKRGAKEQLDWMMQQSRPIYPNEGTK